MGYAESGRINAFVFWTLHYEWLFYLLILPACALMRDALPARVPIWTIPLTLVVIGAAKIGFFPDKGASFLPLFGIGMLTRVVQFQPGLQRFFQTWAVGLAALVGLVAALVLFRSPYYTALPLFGLFFMVVASGKNFGPILRNRGAQVLGACSFGIYVLHGIILSLTFTDGAEWISKLSINWLIAILPLLTCVVVGLSAILHLTVERPAIAVGAGFVKRWKLR
jgi:peptidoglycan/LPS O-acetylase OafA/YrhL